LKANCRLILPIDFFGGPSSWSTSPYNKNKDAYVDVAIIKGEQGHQDSELRSTNCVNHLKELGYQVNVLGDRLRQLGKKRGREFDGNVLSTGD
jgi:hypothetical protein